MYSMPRKYQALHFQLDRISKWTTCERTITFEFVDFFYTHRFWAKNAKSESIIVRWIVKLFSSFDFCISCTLHSVSEYNWNYYTKNGGKSWIDMKKITNFFILMVVRAWNETIFPCRYIEASYQSSCICGVLLQMTLLMATDGWLDILVDTTPENNFTLAWNQ